jgi:nucleoside-diphosphate-sugar epimerase
MASIVLTGALGFIGSHLWAHLLRTGHTVSAVDDLAAWTEPDAVRHRAAMLGLDVDAAFLDGVERWEPDAGHYDAVVHLAGLGGSRAGWGDDLERYLDRNVLALSVMLERTRGLTQRFLFASSSSVYGSGPLPSSERTPPEPLHPYACSKIASELIGQIYSLRDPESQIVGLRFFTVYGPGQREDMAFQRFLSAGRSGASIVMYGDGEQRRSFTYVADVVRVLERLLRAERRPGFSPLNIGNPDSRSLNDAVAIMRGLGLLTGQIEHGEAQIEPRGTASDTTLLEQWVGPVRWIPLEEGLRSHAAAVAEDRWDTLPDAVGSPGS